MHQLTDLPAGLEPAQMAGATVRNARVREEGGGNLAEAAIEAGVRRFIVQSIAWAYAPGPEPHAESDRLDTLAEGPRAVTVSGVAALESYALMTPGLRGVVLRYGQLYGPGTGFGAPSGDRPLHVDAAAFAAQRAVDVEVEGIFNVAELNPHVATERARDELAWSPEFRLV
jgi:nucleoside-diphosphate-sugar epimerase